MRTDYEKLLSDCATSVAAQGAARSLLGQEGEKKYWLDRLLGLVETEEISVGYRSDEDHGKGDRQRNPGLELYR